MDKKEKFLLMLHSDMPRQGPGSDAITEMVLSMIDVYREADPLRQRLKILDIGCGPGMQTIQIARHFPLGEITAVDLYQQYLDEFVDAAVAGGVFDRVNPVQASMDALPFDEKSFDILWSEGAIYILGFQKGLEKWKKLVKPQGWIGVSEISWFSDDRPKELEDFWLAAYPEIDTTWRNLEKIKALDMEPVGTFRFPVKAWFTHYYTPLIDRIGLCRRSAEAGRGNEDPMLQLIEEEEREIELLQKYADYYGYVFYLMRNPETG